MKREIARFMSKCLICQQVKAEHQSTLALLQPLPIPKWKWEKITMHFATLPQSPKHNNAIWVIVDRLTKATHFIPLLVGQSTKTLAEKYMWEAVRFHRVLVSIASDRDMRFRSHFLRKTTRKFGN